MSMISARVGAIALAAFALFPPFHPAQAFGLNFGPLHLNLPVPGVHERGRVARRETPHETPHAAPSEPEEGDRPTLLYSVLAWPSLDAAIFSPRTVSSWPFDYKAIFAQAFAKYTPEQTAELCPYRDASGEAAARIEREMEPNAAQKLLLKRLATALGQANGLLIKSCPREISPLPVARLQLMEGQIDATITALEIIRPPLQKFEQSLDDKQRARFDEESPAAGGAFLACGSRTDIANWPLSQLERAVQPTDAQRKALREVEAAFSRAAAGVAADCRGAVPQTPSGRLGAIENQLDATWRAVETIQVALADFQKKLSDEQKARINALEIASTR